MADPTDVPECRHATVFSGLTARDRGLGTGILVDQAVCSPGGSHLPSLTIHKHRTVRHHNIIVPEYKGT